MGSSSKNSDLPTSAVSSSCSCACESLESTVASMRSSVGTSVVPNPFILDSGAKSLSRRRNGIASKTSLYGPCFKKIRSARWSGVRECGTLESTLSGLGVGTLTALRCAKAGVFARRRYAAGGFYYTQRLEGMFIEGQDTFLGRDAFGGPMILQFALYLSEFVRMGDYTSDEAVDAAAGCLPLPSGQVS